ncbi:unnamed protein product [Urochloa decumbens]|uniref:Alpha/beta-Hydrolases superfamily protein n=2 Tax=Urochloa decumbens TaxID=240449 RepID=A0ABC9FUR3_9POAL
MLLSSRPPPPPHLPRGGAAPSPSPFALVLRRRRRHHHHRTHRVVPRASLSDLLASLPPSLALVGPAALAAAAALTTSFSYRSSSRNSLPPPSQDPDDGSACGDAAGEWVLFTSPTPFNRSVLLRCPSVSFEDGGVNERLLAEERHYVNLSRGRIPAARGGGDGPCGVSYQRICIALEDGGVIALDWPDNLDLDGEHGLDSTVLVVPGTPEGSMERSIKLFVVDALKNGYFPIVMNPRGCGGSPLTTPRLFTAADSDDICTAVRFINSKRPWTTLMGVGWGYGANMVTKYLVEVGESTPLTAAVCIDNPFDLQEATRSFPHHIALDQKLMSGLVDILRANKELFQGKAKDFNVQKALSARSLRDFDGAISMVSHGFDTLDDFYSENSTRLSVARVKIPLLFIQSDDGTVPLISVPRSSISENPFTSLLLCSCVHSTIFTFQRYTVLWCQNLALEWLSAVEFALLKGRHPLIKDVDITFNPSKGLAFVEPQVNERKAKSGSSFHPQSELILYNNVPRGINGLLVDSAKEYSGAENKENGQLKNNGDIQRVNRDPEEESEESSEDVEKGQALQSASVVMNMLDATMPGTLNDDQKKKVLVAVEQGETLVKALEEAVPEDVRGKLTTSVTEILHSKRENFSLDALKRLGWNNVRPTNTKTVAQEKLKDSDHESGLKDTKMAVQNRSSATVADGGQKDTNIANDGNSGESTELSQGKPSQTSGPVGTATETGSEQAQPNTSDKSNSGTNDSSEEQHRTEQSSETTPEQASDDQSAANSNGAPTEKGHPVDSTTDQNPQPCATEKGGDTIRMSEDKAAHSTDDQSTQVSKTEESKPSPITMTQALDALTGFDDSTQMAVNSVFGVLENMIDQLQKQQDSENGENSDENDGGPSVDETESHGKENMENTSSGEDIIQSSQQPEDSSLGITCSIMSKHDYTFGKKNPNLSIVSSDGGKMRYYRGNEVGDHGDADGMKQVSGLPDYLLDIAVNSYLKAQYAMYLNEFLNTQLQLKSPEPNSATDLVLDPQEGKWKIADQMDNVQNDISKSGRYNGAMEEVSYAGCSQEPSKVENVIEPPYFIPGKFPDITHESNELKNTIAARSKPGDDLREALACFIRDELSSALKTEVGRKIGITDTRQLERGLANDVERVAAEVSKLIVLNCELYSAAHVQRSPTTIKFGATHGKDVVEAVATAVQESQHLRIILPVGVLVGVTLACLRNYFHVEVSKHDDHMKATVKSDILREDLIVQDSSRANILDSGEANTNNNISNTHGDNQQEMTRTKGQGMMVGAVTAALGASALVAHQQNKDENHDGKDEIQNAKHEETTQEKGQNNLMKSFAEKALSVAGPVVPTKDDGEVDQERLVAVLAELGQKGGILRFIGKFALLWGGIRGAMSLTDRLISFLRISERPLYQRIMGFSLMVLVLWSPVVIPLLPTLVQSWTISASTGIIGHACIVGLYVSIMILVMQWGKRIRGYEDPVEQYGMNFWSASRLQEFFQGLVGGVVIVGLVHSTSILLGFATFRTGLPSSLARPVDLIKSSSNVFMLALRGFAIATSIAVVEEMVFRSWLPEEIAVDLGYYSAILISGLVFSLIHRSLPSVPGFLLLSLVLFGLKQRTQGKLAAPIGLRSGIMTANYLIQSSRVIISKPETPFWIISTYHLHPFDGVIGLSICSLLAILFFPQKPVQKDTSV